MKRNYGLVIVALTAVAGLAACNGNRNAGMMAAQTPDEFLTVSRSPLVIPPDYALRPPMPGEPRPQELNPEAAARTALVGQRTSIANGTEGERLLLTKAKADAADPRIKEVVDDEQGDLAHKPSGFANAVMFWRKDNPVQPAVSAPTGSQTAAPIDPAAEAKRLEQLTGGQAVTINRNAPAQEKARGFKLPGL